MTQVLDTELFFLHFADFPRITMINYNDQVSGSMLWHSIDGRPVVKNMFLSAWCNKGKLYLYDVVARGEPNFDLLCK